MLFKGQEGGSWIQMAAHLQKEYDKPDWQETTSLTGPVAVTTQDDMSVNQRIMGTDDLYVVPYVGSRTGGGTCFVFTQDK